MKSIEASLVFSLENSKLGLQKKDEKGDQRDNYNELLKENKENGSQNSKIIRYLQLTNLRWLKVS